jgi:hypothetical protein
MTLRTRPPFGLRGGIGVCLQWRCTTTTKPSGSLVYTTTARPIHAKSLGSDVGRQAAPLKPRPSPSASLRPTPTARKVRHRSTEESPHSPEPMGMGCQGSFVVLLLPSPMPVRSFSRLAVVFAGPDRPAHRGSAASAARAAAQRRFLSGPGLRFRDFRAGNRRYRCSWAGWGRCIMCGSV